jgi:AraC-like DNA-binding protein
LQKKPADTGADLKYNLIYFLNPALFSLKKRLKKISINTQHNKLFFSNQVPIDFSVLPNQPFYVLDIAFTASWLMQQLDDADPCLELFLDQHFANPKAIFTEPCSVEDYRTLQELDVSLLAEKNDLLFTRSRIYKLVCTFFNKEINYTETVQTNGLIHYDQVVQAEAIISGNLQALPKLETIAKSVNMSVSSLLRQFKTMYGRSIHEYYVEKKMELAKNLILQQRMAIKEIAGMLGYKQPSPFIEAFTRFYGYSPGSLKAISN